MGIRVGVDRNVRLIIDGVSRMWEISRKRQTKSPVTSLRLAYTSRETDTGERFVKQEQEKQSMIMDKTNGKANQMPTSLRLLPIGRKAAGVGRGDDDGAGVG